MKALAPTSSREYRRIARMPEDAVTAPAPKEETAEQKPAPVRIPPRPPRTPTAPPVAPDPHSLRVLLPDNSILRVPRLPDDHIARHKAEWEAQEEARAEDERLAAGYTITRAYDLCSRLAERAADGNRERVVL